MLSTIKFHKMEEKHELFSLNGKSNYPVWDVLRLYVFFKIYYEKDDFQRGIITRKLTLKKIIGLLREFFLSFYLLLFQSGKNIFLTSSGAKNLNGKYFDKSALPIIEAFFPNFFIIESNTNSNFLYKSFNGFFKIFIPLLKTENLIRSDFNRILYALAEYFPDLIIDFHELNKVFIDFQYDFRCYKFIFSIKKTQNLFVSRGNEKGAFFAGKSLGINTFEIQHAAIEFDNPLYSYPCSISKDSNIAYSNIFLSFGSFWMKQNHFPCKKKYSLGIEHPSIKSNSKTEESILIISTIIHGDELASLAKELSEKDKNEKIIFKIHPNEYHRKQYFKKFFFANINIQIISDELNVNELIIRSKLVIVIVSTVLYEAITLGKKVAVYKKLNFSSQINAFSLPNVYCFDSISDVFEILDKPTIKSFDIKIFEPLNKDLIKSIVNQTLKL